MRELLSAFYLVFLQGTSLVLTGIGGAFNSAGTVFHVIFIRHATRHDNKHALKPEEYQQPSETIITGQTVSAGRLN